MATQRSWPFAPARDPADQTQRQSVSRGDSQSSNGSFASKSEKRARFNEGMNNGLGIQMMDMGTPISPDSVYRLKGGQYSPLSPPPPFNRSGSMSTSMSRSRTDPITQRLIEHRATQAARWTIHWRR